MRISRSRVDATRCVASFETADLAGFGIADETVALGAAGALLRYLRQTQALEDSQRTLAHVRRLVVEREDRCIALDAATRRNLEISENLAATELRGASSRSSTLFGLLDVCATHMGSRLLRQWLHEPLRDRVVPSQRSLAIEALIARSGAGLHAEDLHARLAGTADVERIAARIALRSARPRDLAGLREALSRLDGLRDAIAAASAVTILEGTSTLGALIDELATPRDALDLLVRAIAPEPRRAVARWRRDRIGLR